MASDVSDKRESKEHGGPKEPLSILIDRLGLSEETKLTVMDGRTFNTSLDKGKSLQTDAIACFFQDISANDRKAADNLRENYKKLGNENTVSSRDLMFTIFICCDQFLLQQTLSKLVKCNIAVPALLHDWKSEKVTFLSWELRQCNDVPCNKYPFMTISALRFGDVILSKSQILNALYRNLHGCEVGESFMSNRLDPGTRTWSVGTVEYMQCLANCKEDESLSFWTNFLNLRGDAPQFEKQLRFCCKHSQILIVFTELKRMEHVLRDLTKLNSSVHIIFVLHNAENSVGSKHDRVSVVTLTDPKKIAWTIQKIIAEVCSAAKFSSQPLDEMKRSCENFHIADNEASDICLKAKAVALELNVAVITPKSKLFPQQKLWNDWIISVETVENDDKRRQQLDELKVLQLKGQVSVEMRKFITIATDSDKELVNYFIGWFQMLVREMSCKSLQSIIDSIKINMKKRKDIYGELDYLKSSQTGDWPKHRKDYKQNKSKEEKEELNQKDYNEYQKLDAKVVEQEDFLREIGHVFECKRPFQSVNDEDINSSKVVQFAVDLLINGHCIELFRKKAGYVPFNWIRAIFDRLHSLMNNKPTARVVSIIGGPSTGKSHLLNNTFGTNFHEGEGRCTRGVRLAIVPLHTNIQILCKCEFLIIADTESVNVNEKTVAASLKMNNYISTIVGCISDIVVINIGKDDTPQEVRGTLTIALRGLQRGIDLGEASKACIVQGFSKIKNKPKQKDVFEKLERVSQSLDKKGHDSKGVDEFSQIKTDQNLLNCFSRGGSGTTRVQNIQFLFIPESHHTMEDNQRYTSNVKSLRVLLMQMLCECNKAPRFFTEFAEHAQDVVHSMESDNFILAFQTATFRKRCDAFLTQCEQALNTIRAKLRGKTDQVSDDMVSAVNTGKRIEEVQNVEQKELQELSELAISDTHNLLQKIQAESKKKHFQAYSKDIQVIKEKVELFRDTQLETITSRIQTTTTRIIRYLKAVEHFHKTLLATMVDLEKNFTESCDQLCSAEQDKIRNLIKGHTRKLTDQLNENIDKVNKELHALKHNEFKGHFEGVKESFLLNLSSYKEKLMDVIQNTSDEVNKMLTYVSQCEQELVYIQNELSQNLSVMSSTLNEESNDLDDTLNKRSREIEALANDRFEKIHTEIESNINTKLFPHIHKRLINKSCLALETFIQDARKQLKTSADRIKETRALQNLTKTLEIKKRKEKREKYVLQFNAVLTTIQQDLEAKLMAFCRIIMSADLANIDKVHKSKDEEFTKVAKISFVKLLSATSQETGKSIENKEYKSFEASANSVQKRILMKMNDQFKGTVAKAKKIKERDEKVIQETKHFMKSIKEGLQEEKHIPKSSIKEKFEKTFIPFISSVKEKNPLPSISGLKKIKETKLISRVQEKIVSNKSSQSFNDLSEFTNTSKSIESKDDVAKISKDFCVVDERNEKNFNHLTSSILDLSKDFVHFERNAHEIVKMIRRFELNSTLFIDRVSLFCFLCSKCISSAHEMHLQAEIRQLQRKKDSGSGQSKKETTKVTSNECSKVEFTEPLNFSSLDSKVKYFRSIFIDLKETAIAETLSEVTVKNYGNLPLTIKTVNRIDSCFMRILPPLKAEDMQHLHETVNGAKEKIIGKTISKMSYAFDQYFDDIREAAENSTLGKEKNEKVSAAAITHLSAWSTNFMAIKDLEGTKETNVALAVEQKERSYLINLYKECDHSCDDVIAEEVCKQIETALDDCVEEEFVKILSEEMSKNYTEKNLKRAVIGTILESFLEKEDYKGCIQFVNNFSKLCDKWTLDFLASDCNKERESLIHKLNESLIDSKIDTANKALRETAMVFEKSDRKVQTWLVHFKTLFNQYSDAQIFLEENVVLDTGVTVNDPSYFSEECCKKLTSLKEALRNKRDMPEKGNLDATRTWLLSLPNNIHVELSTLIKGCVEQCPFCGHPCDKDLSKHDIHGSSLHIPRGLKGSFSTRTNLLTPSICNAAVKKGTGKFKVKELEGVWKDYKKSFPTWEISPGDDVCIPFWKYIFQKYNAEFSKYHERTSGFEEDWGNINMNDARSSLNETYLNMASLDT